MSRREKTAIWGVLAVIGSITLIFLALPSVPPTKARAQRITAVNTLSTVTLTMTNASTLPPIHR